MEQSPPATSCAGSSHAVSVGVATATHVFALSARSRFSTNRRPPRSAPHQGTPLGANHRLNLLGGAALQGRNGPVEGRAAHRRRLALLAILAVARGRAVGRERIVGLLWPEQT